MAESQRVELQDAVVGHKYHLGARIGSGGVATAYKAVHLWTERVVAVKVLDSRLRDFEQLRETFLREARSMVRLHHPNVVDILDMGEDDSNKVYLVMEYLEGPTLRDVLHDRGPISPDEAMAILLPLIDALDKAHQLGIVHGDFKPENIILSADPDGTTTPKLLDFGGAQIDAESRAHFDPDQALIMGTPQYMSPEQARNESHVGPHTDVWGLGVVLYECLTGRAAFGGDDTSTILTNVCEAPLDFEGMADEYAVLLREMLARPVIDRTATLADVKTRLHELGIVTSDSKIPELSPDDSWSPPDDRESYIQRTLHGIGPVGPSLPAPLPVAGITAAPADDLELVSLPQSSTSGRAVRVGLVLTVVVTLAAWWSVRVPTATQRDPSTSIEPAERSPSEALVVEPPPAQLSTTPTPIESKPGDESLAEDLSPDVDSNGEEVVSPADTGTPVERRVRPGSGSRKISKSTSKRSSRMTSGADADTAAEPDLASKEASKAETAKRKARRRVIRERLRREQSAKPPEPQSVPEPADADETPRLVTEW